jgi:hypothetical protein
MSYSQADLSLFEPLDDPAKRQSTSYFEFHPKQLPRTHACWLPGSFFIRDAAFDFFSECFHKAQPDFDYFATQRLSESEISALCRELEAYLSALAATPTEEVLFSRYASIFDNGIWAHVEVQPLTSAVSTCGRRLLNFITENTRESKCLWVLGM